MAYYKNDSGKVFSGWVQVKNPWKYEFRVCMLHENILHTETLVQCADADDFVLVDKVKTNPEFISGLHNTITSELMSFSQIDKGFNISSVVDDVIKKAMLCPLRKNTRTIEELLHSCVYRVCMGYLQPNIHIVDRRLELGCILSTKKHVYTTDRVLSYINAEYTSYSGHKKSYFDSIEINVGYLSRISKDEIRGFLTQNKQEVYEFVYDCTFRALMRRTSLWNRIPEILEAMRFLRIDKVLITNQNIIVFKFILKEEN